MLFVTGAGTQQVVLSQAPQILSQISSPIPASQVQGAAASSLINLSSSVPIIPKSSPSPQTHTTSSAGGQSAKVTGQKQKPGHKSPSKTLLSQGFKPVDKQTNLQSVISNLTMNKEGESTLSAVEVQAATNSIQSVSKIALSSGAMAVPLQIVSNPAQVAAMTGGIYVMDPSTNQITTSASPPSSISSSVSPSSGVTSAKSGKKRNSSGSTAKTVNPKSKTSPGNKSPAINGSVVYAQPGQTLTAPAGAKIMYDKFGAIYYDYNLPDRGLGTLSAAAVASATKAAAPSAKIANVPIVSPVITHVQLGQVTPSPGPAGVTMVPAGMWHYPTSPGQMSVLSPSPSDASRNGPSPLDLSSTPSKDSSMPKLKQETTKNVQKKSKINPSSEKSQPPELQKEVILIQPSSMSGKLALSPLQTT